MEKHPIDSRFKEGLGGFRPQPSADAWARLQSRMAEETAPETAEEEPQKKRFALWYSIAAAIALLLISAGIYRVNFTVENAPVVATVKTGKAENLKTGEVKNNRPLVTGSEKTVSENQNLVATNNAANSTETGLETAKESTIEAPVEKRSSIKSGNPATQISNAVAAIRPVQTPENQKKVHVKTEIKVPAAKKNTAEEENMLAVTAVSKPEAASETKPAANLPENVLEIVVIKTQPQAVLAVTQTEDAQLGRGELVKNIFKQARNLKNGEKVDLQEIGIASDSRLAVETKHIKRNLTEKFTKVLAL